MREPDVVGGEVTSVHLEFRIVVGRRLPIGTRRSRLEVPTTPEAVALGHLATHVDDLAIPGKLPEDSANSQGLGPQASQLQFLQHPPVPPAGYQVFWRSVSRDNGYVMVRDPNVGTGQGNWAFVQRSCLPALSGSPVA